MKRLAAAIAVASMTAAPALAEEGGGPANAPAAGPACVGFGPQTPRDIDRAEGGNPTRFALAPAPAEMNLCNIHFHRNAEHRARAFPIHAGDGDGQGSGYRCEIGTKLTAAEKAPTAQKICEGAHGGLVPGDTIEVHWVFSSCDVAPGPTLGSCLSEACANPQLRVEAQVFTLVNDPDALDFATLRHDPGAAGARPRPRALPTGTGTPVVFRGSTTGPSYSAQVCSPFQVTWSVRPLCARLDIASIGEFCKDNVFDEDHAHGVRALVTDPALLSPIE